MIIIDVELYLKSLIKALFVLPKTKQRVWPIMKGSVRSSQLYLKRNASTILTVVGGVGVVTTTVLAIKATPKALSLLDNAKQEKGENLTKLEKIRVAAPVYIPTMISGVATLACVFGANVLNKRQQAGLMSAYALLDNSYKEYKAKVEELYGEGSNDHVKEEIAKDKYEKTEVNDGEILFYDDFSGQFFTSTLIRVAQAEYNINRDIHMRGWAELNEFYEYLDIDNIDGGDVLGWSEGGNLARYWQAWIDFNHKKVVVDDDTEYIVLTMFQEPYMEWEC